jgi:hypothetical protein
MFTVLSLRPYGGHFAGLRVPPLCPSVRTLRDVGTSFCARDDGCFAFALLHSAECVRARFSISVAKVQKTFDTAKYKLLNKCKTYTLPVSPCPEQENLKSSINLTQIRKWKRFLLDVVWI